MLVELVAFKTRRFLSDLKTGDAKVWTARLGYRALAPPPHTSDIKILSSLAFSPGLYVEAETIQGRPRPCPMVWTSPFWPVPAKKRRSRDGALITRSSLSFNKRMACIDRHRDTNSPQSTAVQSKAQHHSTAPYARKDHEHSLFMDSLPRLTILNPDESLPVCRRMPVDRGLSRPWTNTIFHLTTDPCMPTSIVSLHHVRSSSLKPDHANSHVPCSFGKRHELYSLPHGYLHWGS